MQIHPALVHFPIALLLAAFVMDVAGLALKKDKLRDAAFYTLIGAELGGLLAVITGLLAHDDIEKMTTEVHELIETHELLAFITLGSAVVAMALRLVAIKKKDLGGLFGKLSLSALLVAVVFVTITGFFGGKIVFDHGAGTALYDKMFPDAQLHGDHGIKPNSPAGNPEGKSEPRDEHHH